jgi:hypothetical protein
MRQFKTRSLRFEALERRAMLAGNVDMTIDGTILRFTGDGAGNHFTVVGQSLSALQIFGDNTNILFNGVSQGMNPSIAGNFTALSFDLNAGDDTLQIKDIDATIGITNITIATDEGADVVRLGDYETYVTNPASIIFKPYEMTLTGGLQIDTGTGADLLQVVSVLTPSWDIDLGDSDGTNNNNDGRPENNFFIPLDDQAYIYVGQGNALDVNGGTGDDLININYLTTNGPLTVNGVSGNDVLSANGCVFKAGAVMLAGGVGADTIALDFSRHDGQGPTATINMDTGSDSDFVLFARCLMQGAAVAIGTGSGFDRVVIGRYYANAAGNLATGGNIVGTVSLSCDTDADTADVRGNVVQSFFANFGAGNDNVDFLNNDVRPGGGSLDGGLDSDRLTLLGNLGAITTLGFEAQDSVFESDFA